MSDRKRDNDESRRSTANRDQRDPDAIATEIVRAAYSTSVLPQEFHAFNVAVSQLLEARPESAPDDAELDRWLKQQVTSVESHVTHALDLSERRDPAVLQAPGARRLVLEDPRPSALLRPNGRIYLANATAQALGLDVGVPITRLLDDGQSRKRYEAFANAEGNGFGASIPMVTVALTPSQSRFTLTRVVGDDGSVVFRLTALRAAFEAAIGERMAADFGLTPSEVLVLAALVEGKKLGELAETTGKAIGTLRNQLKSSFAKTQMSSQADLVSLYGIYARQQTSFPLPQHASATQQSPIVQKASITLEDGRRMRCTFAGPKSGRPVMYLNAVLTGHELPDPFLAGLVKAGIRLVIPWRAGWEHSDPYPDMQALSPASYIERTVTDLVDIADQLKMDRFACIASNAGVVFAYALANRCPDRVASLTAFSPIMPIRSASDLRARGRQQRPYLVFARYAPSLVRAYCRFSIAKVDAGFDEEHAELFFAEDLADLATVRTESGKAHMRRAIADARLQGVDAMALDIVLRASKWHRYLQGVTCPVHLICGAQDTSIVPSQVERFVSDLPQTTVEWFEDAGNLIILQKPAALADSIRRHATAD